MWTVVEGRKRGGGVWIIRTSEMGKERRDVVFKQLASKSSFEGEEQQKPSKKTEHTV
jgi:hypothetical protein